MNCRRVNSLLSAYLDAELTGTEMLGIREHMKYCSSCLHEYESLQETKRLVASLAFKAPRAELEALLLAQAAQASQPLSSRWAAQVNQWLSVGSGRIQTLLRPRPLAATALLSVAGLWMATGVLDRTEGIGAAGDMTPSLFANGGNSGAGSVVFSTSAGNTPPYAAASAFTTLRPALTPMGFSTRNPSSPAPWAEGNSNLSSPAMLVTASRAIFAPR